MNIVDKIKGSIHDATGMPVYYDNTATLNVVADNAQYPCAFFQLLTTGQLDIEGGQMKERVAAEVYFVELGSFDYDGSEEEVIIDRCKQSALAWLRKSDIMGAVSVLSVERTRRVYSDGIGGNGYTFDAIVCGYGLVCTVKEMEGYSGCEEDAPW